jgi:hypothetical protein
VWAEETEVINGVTNCVLHAETDLLVRVPETEELYNLVSVSNAFSTLSALIYDPDDGSVGYKCSIFVHAQIERWMSPLFTHIVVIQAADSYLRAEQLQKTFGGEIALSSHPNSGERPGPDGMLEVIKDIYAPQGEYDPPWPEEEFEAVAQMASPSVMSSSSESGLTAEFPFYGDSPGIELMQKNLPPETALFQATTTEPHPQMGNGCLCRLSLPIDVEDSSVVNKLNGLELAGDSLCPVVGSWVQHRSTLTHVAFLPNAVHVPGLLSLFYLRAALRAQWASLVLNS